MESYWDDPTRTDLAVEAHAAAGRGRRLEGVTVEASTVDGVQREEVRVRTESAARRLGKPVGRYVTLNFPDLLDRDREGRARLTDAIRRELDDVMALSSHSQVLVVGLGNWNATPDALGPRVVGRIVVTRHLHGGLPQDLRGRLRPVAAVAPGVLGITGMETGEIVQGIVERVRPDVVVAIDALAARSVHRIGTTFQIADTGIHPGSGVGNRRAALNRETLGVPVIAVGVPTVVHALTIVRDAMHMMVERLRERSEFLDLLGEDEDEILGLIGEVVDPAVGSMMVTPKEIDRLIGDLVGVLAGALNASLHPGITPQIMEWYN